MILILRDDSVIETFADPKFPPSWIEVIDVSNKEYRFCSDYGQRYIGKINKSPGLFKPWTFVLQPEGQPDIRNALELVDNAKNVETNEKYTNLDDLRNHIMSLKK